jgi:hypothetical protein
VNCAKPCTRGGGTEERAVAAPAADRDADPARGNQIFWPATTIETMWRAARFDLDDYSFVTAAG